MTCPRGDTAENFSSNFSSSVGGVLKRKISYLQAAMQCSVNITPIKKFTFICFYVLLLRKAHSHSNDDILTSREFLSIS